VKPRLVLATALALAVGGGLAVPALAAQDTTRHKVCVLGPTPAYPNQEGICIAWNDPLNK
jgi:hypothetical protein